MDKFEDGTFVDSEESSSPDEIESPRKQIANLLSEISERPSAVKYCTIFWSIIVVLLMCFFGLVGYGVDEPRWQRLQVNQSLIDEARNQTVATAGDAALASVIGLVWEEQTRCIFCVNLALIAVVGSAVTSLCVATCSPHLVPEDFTRKGTLSNTSQFVDTAWGRAFAVSLFTGSLFVFFSKYTVWLYRCWLPLWDNDTNPAKLPQFESFRELFWRTAWGTLPFVGFMFTAAFPSLSNSVKYEIVLTGVHNVAAPISMAFLLSMETVQLSYGENAFQHFFSNEPVGTSDVELELLSSGGPITTFQRMRVVILCYAWLAGGIFLAIQIYFGIGDCFNFKIKERYGLALFSMYSEVLCLYFVFILPALAGLETAKYTWGRTATGEASLTTYMLAHRPR